MFMSVMGQVTGLGVNTVVVDTGGFGGAIGLVLRVTEAHASSLVKGEQASFAALLRTGKLVKSLYGFESESRRALFARLVAVQGVGPEMALAVVGHVSDEEMQAPTTSKSLLTTLRRVPGIGPNTAERVAATFSDKP